MRLHHGVGIKWARKRPLIAGWHAVYPAYDVVGPCKRSAAGHKLIDKEKPIAADYIGLNVPNRYVFGFGMDAAGCWRNLGEIYALKQH